MQSTVTSGTPALNVHRPVRRMPGRAHSRPGEAWPVLEQACRPVFVVGMNGSGTTMLLDSLGRHPELYSFPQETRVIPHLMARSRRLGDLNDDANFRRLWQSVLSIPAFRLVNGGTPPALPVNWAEFPREFAAVLDAAFRYFAGRQDKVRWCEKTPQHVQHLDRLQQVFPEARFIHMIRDGRDCAASFERRWSRRPELTIYRWKHVVSVGRAQGERLAERYLEVKYEDLTAAPDHWMHRICEFLGLAFHPDVLLSRRPQSARPPGTQSGSGRIERTSERWRGRFSSEQLGRLERIAGGYLAELGYPTLQYPEGCEEPSAWRVRCWMAVDYVRQWAVLMARKLRGETYKPWSMLMRLPAIALRQSRNNRY